MKLISLGNFDGSAEYFIHGGGEVFTRITAIDQHIFYFRQRFFVKRKPFQRAGSIGDVGGSHQQHMRQPLCIHANMPLDARHQLAAVEPFLLRRIRVFHTLCINDEEAGFLFPTIVLSGLANQFFLKLPQGCFLFHLRVWRSNR